MAVVPDPRWRVTDATGAAIVGATLTIYTAGTVNPATVYSDAALTTPITLDGAHASDAQGYFPQWFAAEGVLLDITAKTSGGAAIADRSYVSVPSLGADTGSLTRDFTGSRLRIANLAGVVRVEGGPAVGDDTGGLITLGGYNGTQSDGIVLDGASIDTTGPYLEQGKKIPGVVATAKTTFSAVSSIAIPLPNSPTGVLVWEVDVFGLFFDTVSAKISATVSLDGGSTYLATGYAGRYIDASGTTIVTAASSTSKMDLSNLGALNTASPAHLIHIRITQASIATGNILIEATYCGALADGSHFKATSSAHLSGGTRISHIKLTPSTGLVSGSYRVAPLRGFGE